MADMYLATSTNPYYQPVQIELKQIRISLGKIMGSLDTQILLERLTTTDTLTVTVNNHRITFRKIVEEIPPEYPFASYI